MHSYTPQQWTIHLITTPAAPLSNRCMNGGDMSLGMLPKTNYRRSIVFRCKKLFDKPTRCLEHVINLANIAVMSHITKIAAVENQTAIWEYDPDEADNRVLGGSLDVIAAIRTIAIKVSRRTDYRIT
jgi:hypothetical protein